MTTIRSNTKARVLLPLLLEGILHSDEEGRTVKVSPNNLSNLPNTLYYFTDLRSADDILRRADLLTSFSLESGDRNVGALPFYISFTTNPSFRSGFPKNRQIDINTNGKRHLLPLARFSVNVPELLKLSEKERAFTDKKKNGTLNSFEYQFTQRQREQGKGPESEVRFCYRKPVLRKFVKAVDQITLCNTEYDTDWLQFLAKNIVDDAKLYGIPVKYVTDYGAEKEKDLQIVQNLYTPFGGKKFRNSNKALDFIPNKKLRSKFVNVFATCLVPSLIGERSTAAKINTFFRDIEKSFKSFWKGEYNEISIVEKDFTLFKKEVITKAEEFIYNGNIPEREIQSNLNDCKHADFEGFKGIQHSLLYHVFLFCKEHRNISRAIQNLNNMLENMKSERQLLRENLERFRVARSHKTEDPAKGSLKFRRLNEDSREDYKRRQRRQAVGNWNKSVGQYVMQHSEEIEQATKDNSLPNYVRNIMMPALGDEAKTYLEGILQEPRNRNSEILQQRLWYIALAGDGLGTKGIYYSSSKYQKENKEALNEESELQQSSDKKKLKSFAEKVKERWGKCQYTYEGPDYIALISFNDDCDPTVHEGIFEREALKAGVSIAMFEEDYDSVCLEGYIVNSQNTLCIWGPCSVGDFPSLGEYLDSLASNLADEREEYDLRTVEHDDWCGLSWQLVSDEFGIEFDRDGEVVAGPSEGYGHFDNDTEDELSWEAAGCNTDHLVLNGEEIHTKEQYEKLEYLFDNYEFIEED